MRPTLDSPGSQVDTPPSEAEWDQFVESCPHGHFEQSSAWACMKQEQGWDCFRVVLRNEAGISGGFQILYRSTRFGRVGYLSKGPTFLNEEPDAFEPALVRLKQAGKQLKLRALILQPPLSSEWLERSLEAKGFLANHRLGIIQATWAINVAADLASIESNMNRTKRRLIRQAQRCGVAICEGQERDIPIFYNQMLETCRRQKTRPNPPHESDFHILWNQARHSGGCRLTIAERRGQPVAALFCIPFGRVVHVWKKGSIASGLEVHAMELLYHEVLAWAHQHRYQLCDFGSINRTIAETLLRNKPLTDQQMKSRDCFNIGFGGFPVLFPSPRLLFFNPFIQGCWRLLAPWFSRK